jgi:hypothetical protein
MTRKMKHDVERKCVQCKGVFKVTQRNTRKDFCSDKCRWQWHNKHRPQELREEVNNDQEGSCPLATT